MWESIFKRWIPQNMINGNIILINTAFLTYNIKEFGFGTRVENVPILTNKKFLGDILSFCRLNIERPF